MNIVEFFQYRAGTWTSYRTSHHIIIKKAEDGTSEINLEMLALPDPQVTELCEQHGFDPSLALCGAKVTWNGSMAWDKKDTTSGNPHQGFTIFVPIAGENIQEGKLLRHQGYAEQTPVVGRYVMSDDNILSLITEYGTVYSEEKFWFPEPNVCLRAGLTIGLSNVSSFCTETRHLPTTGSIADQTNSEQVNTLESANYFSFFGG
jgi:CpeS-like protein